MYTSKARSRAAGLDAGDALHLGRRLQVLEIMRLVDEDVIDAEFVEHQPVILLVLGEQVLQAFGSGGLLLLDGLDEVAVGSLGARVFAQQLVVFGDLLAQELLLVVARHADPLEAAVGDDDAVPLAAGDLGGQELAAVPRQIFLGGDEQLGIGIELHELAGELLQQVVGDDVHRLLDEAGLLHLHAGGGHRERLAGADDVGSSVLPELMPRQTASFWCGRSLMVWFMPGKSRCEPSNSRGRRLL